MNNDYVNIKVLEQYMEQTMFNKLTIGELERARLVLRGGTVIDWRRLNISTADECNAILLTNGFHPDEPRDQIYLSRIRDRAIDYLKSNFGFTFKENVTDAPHTRDLMFLAAGRDPVLRPQACMVLKLMHVIHYVEAMELRSKIAVAEHELYNLAEQKVTQVLQKMKEIGYPILEFNSSRKTADSLITKILNKKKTIRARILDITRFRIVTETADDIVPLVGYFNAHLFPFNYTVTGESRNSIFEFKDYIFRHPQITKLAPELQIDLTLENEMRPPVNEDTSDFYRIVSFVVDLPLRLEKDFFHKWASTMLPKVPAIIHIPVEFQLVDKASNAANEAGASHEKYKARQYNKVLERLLRGRLQWRGKDESL